MTESKSSSLSRRDLFTTGAGIAAAVALQPATAQTVALETVLGTAWMAATNQESMDSVARRVASPGGTTQQGLNVLDGDNGLTALMSEALAAASRRGEELAEEARGVKLAEKAPSA